MFQSLDFFRSHLSSAFNPEDNTMTLPASAVQLLDGVGIGNHTYLVLRSGKFFEVVKYTHVENFKDKRNKRTITIERDILNTGRKTFAVGTCVKFEWFELAICEFKCES